MAAAFRAVGTAVENTGTTLTCAFTAQAGDFLLFPFSIHDELSAPDSAVWNGTDSMTLLGYLGNSGTRGCGAYGLIAPTTGTHNAVITHATSETMAGVLLAYTGVDTSTAYDGVVTDAEATGDTTLDVSPTSPAGDKAIVIACVADPSVTMSLTNGTQRAVVDTSNFSIFLFDRDGQGGATQINGSFSADPFGFTTLGANLNAAASGLHRHMSSYRRRRAS